MVSSWSAAGPKEGWAFLHTHRWEKDTWEMDNRFLITVGRWQWTLFHQRAGWAARSFFGLGSMSVKGMAGLSLICCLPQEVVGCERRATGFPVQLELAQCEQNILSWWRAGSVTLCWDAGNSTASLLHSSLGFLSLLFFLCLWQSRCAPGSFLASHGLD